MNYATIKRRLAQVRHLIERGQHEEADVVLRGTQGLTRQDINSVVGSVAWARQVEWHRAGLR